MENVYASVVMYRYLCLQISTDQDGITGVSYLRDIYIVCLSNGYYKCLQQRKPYNWRFYE